MRDPLALILKVQLLLTNSPKHILSRVSPSDPVHVVVTRIPAAGGGRQQPHRPGDEQTDRQQQELLIICSSIWYEVLQKPNMCRAELRVRLCACM